MKSETNSIDRSYRKIEIKIEALEGKNLILIIKYNNVRISTITKFYKNKAASEERKLLPPEDGN